METLMDKKRKDTLKKATYTFLRMWITKEWVPFQVIELLHGIQREDDALWGAFRAWSLSLRRSKEVMRPDDFINRHLFETFLQRSALLPIRLAAARLGMETDSFIELIDTLETKGRIKKETELLSSQIVSESFVRSISDLFPDLKHQVFSNYNRYCTILHRAIKKDLKINIRGLYCVTSRAIEENPGNWDFAYEFDCLNGDPVGLRYQVWLDTKKPINLRPDVCSILLFKDHIKDLKPLLFSNRMPEIPQKLRKAAVG